MKEIDLLHLTDADVDVIVNHPRRTLISESKQYLRRLIYKLIEKLESNENSDFFRLGTMSSYTLSTCAFNKSGDKFITDHTIEPVKYGIR